MSSPPFLNAKHVADLEASGLTRETWEAAGVYSESSPERIAKLLKWKKPWAERGAALVFEFYALDGSRLDYHRLKMDHPAAGDEKRYAAPKDQPPRAYFPPLVRQVWQSADPLLICEGEKKALAGCQHGFPTIGLSGVWCWKRKNEQTLLPELRPIPWKSRLVFIVFDSDRAMNPRVRKAEAALAAALAKLGADVRVVTLQPGPDGAKTGLDDFFVRGGTPQLFRDLLEAAVPSEGVAGDGYEYTDIGNGRRLADVAGHDVRFVADRDCWLAWDGNRWQSRGAEVRVEAIAKDMLLTWAKSAAGKIAKAAQALAEAETEEEKNSAKVALAAARKELAFAKKSQDWRSVKRMIAAARSEPVVCIQSYRETFDRHPWFFNCPNGTIDLRTGELRPHAREDLLTRLCPVAYDPKAKAPLYLKFLSDIFRKRDKLVSYIRTLSGVVCTGDVSTRTLHFFYGTGSNGKSVLIELWMETLGPDEYALKLPDGVLVNEGSNTQHPTELADLAGVRFAVANETEQTGKLAESRVKAMTGGDTMAARRMRQDFFRFDPSHKLVIASNYKPRIKGVDHGIWSRIRLCPFDEQFWTDADKDANPNKTFDEALKADPGLKAKLLAENPGVLADMIRAAGEFYRSGLKLRAPKEILAATKDYRKAEDTIGEFFSERVVPDEDTVKQPKDRNKVAAAGLHKAYRLWADDRGEKPCGSRTFGAYAKTRLEYGTSSGVGFYYCQLRDTPIPNDEDKVPAADQTDGEGGDSGDRFPDEQPKDKNASQGAHAKNGSHPPHPHQGGCGDLWAGIDLDPLRM